MQEVRNFVRKTIDAFNRKDSDAVCSLIMLDEGEPNLQQLQNALYNVRRQGWVLPQRPALAWSVCVERLSVEPMLDVELCTVNHYLRVTTTHECLDDRRLNTRDSTKGDKERIAVSQGSDLQLFAIHYRVLSEQVLNGRCLRAPINVLRVRIPTFTRPEHGQNIAPQLILSNQ